MSKVSFRARALDASKPMPVYKACEIPDMKDFAQINRSVPQMPTGMEKEEETVSNVHRTMCAMNMAAILDLLVFSSLSYKTEYITLPCLLSVLKFIVHVIAVSV